MTVPTAAVRMGTYQRDSYRCAECGTTADLTWQHRESSGHGGRGKKAPPLTPADGVTLCLRHNVAAEAEGQTGALARGWKLRRNRGGIPAHRVPFFVAWALEWWLPDTDGGKQVMGVAEAFPLLRAVGAFTTKGAA